MGYEINWDTSEALPLNAHCHKLNIANFPFKWSAGGMHLVNSEVQYLILRNSPTPRQHHQSAPSFHHIQYNHISRNTVNFLAIFLCDLQIFTWKKILRLQRTSRIYRSRRAQRTELRTVWVRWRRFFSCSLVCVSVHCFSEHVQTFLHFSDFILILLQFL